MMDVLLVVLAVYVAIGFVFGLPGYWGFFAGGGFSAVVEDARVEFDRRRWIPVGVAMGLVVAVAGLGRVMFGVWAFWVLVIGLFLLIGFRWGVRFALDVACIVFS
jgi:hypothetical protein